MYIGELARLSGGGGTAKAIRLYEQMGLLSPQRRGSYRLYTAHHLTLVQMIRTAQAVGFKLGRRSLKWTRQGRGGPQGTESSAGIRTRHFKIIVFVKSHHPCIDSNRADP